MRLTEKYVSNIRVEDRIEVGDESCKGLALRVSPKGTKSWAYRYKQFGKMRRVTLGEYPVMSLADARAMADIRRADLKQGRNPVVEDQRENLAKQEAADVLTFNMLAERFIQIYTKPKKRSWAADQRYLRIIGSTFGHRELASIRKSELVAYLTTVAETSIINANRMQSCLHTMYRWANQVAVDTVANPLAGIKKVGGKEKTKDRILTADELRRVWPGLVANDSPFTRPVGIALRLMLLTAQRPNEVAGMRLDELHDLDGPEPFWEIPAARMKGGRTHMCPLSPAAVEHIKQALMLAGAGGSPYVFPARSGGKAAMRRDAMSKAVCRWLAPASSVASQPRSTLAPMTDWTPHDLRRTAGTIARARGVARTTVDALMVHKNPGVSGVYDRYDLAAEKREAVMLIANHLTHFTT
jgi:integrase